MPPSRHRKQPRRHAISLRRLPRGIERRECGGQMEVRRLATLHVNRQDGERRAVGKRARAAHHPAHPTAHHPMPMPDSTPENGRLRNARLVPTRC